MLQKQSSTGQRFMNREAVTTIANIIRLVMEYTIIGDAVNIASRLESYNKKIDTGILISHRAYQKIKGLVYIGRQEPVNQKAGAVFYDDRQLFHFNGPFI